MTDTKNLALLLFLIGGLLTVAALGQQPEIYRPYDTNRVARQIRYTLPFTTRAQAIDVEIVNGKAILDGDIIVAEAALIGAPVIMSAANRDKRWPNGVIPYVISTGHRDSGNIKAAINEINSRTNLTLVERTNQTDYVEFVTGGCASWIGRQGGRQEIDIEGCSLGSIQHEILHAAGLYHEQSRSDRDSNVTVHWANIEAGKDKNFKTYIERELAGVDLGSYDYGSIMHYHSKAFSKNDEATITPNDKNAKIGQRDGLSSGDLSGLGALYPKKSERFETDMLPSDRITAPPRFEPRVIPLDKATAPPRAETRVIPLERATAPPRAQPRVIPEIIRPW